MKKTCFSCHFADPEHDQTIGGYNRLYTFFRCRCFRLLFVSQLGFLLACINLPGLPPIDTRATKNAKKCWDRTYLLAGVICWSDPNVKEKASCILRDSIASGEAYCGSDPD